MPSISAWTAVGTELISASMEESVEANAAESTESCLFGRFGEARVRAKKLALVRIEVRIFKYVLNERVDLTKI